MTPAYVLKSVSFSYGNGMVLDSIHLEIAAGEIVALVGPNGCGKTTLLHLLAFVLRPERGSIRFFGEEWSADKVISLRRRVGLLMQQPYLFRTTVLENVMWGLRIRGVSRRKARALAMEALERVGLSGFEARMPRSLSGGEFQAVALARAIAANPDVMLLDEPANHLDAARVGRAEEIFLDANTREGKTVVFSTHDMALGERLAQRAIDMRDYGPAVDSGTPGESLPLTGT